MDEPRNLNDSEHTLERGAIQELVADVATVTLDATKQNCPWFKPFLDALSVGAFERTSLEAVVLDGLDHTYEIGHAGYLRGFEPVNVAVSEA